MKKILPLAIFLILILIIGFYGYKSINKSIKEEQQGRATGVSGVDLTSEVEKSLQEEKELLNPSINKQLPTEWTLVIPKINVRWKIVDGNDTDKALLAGFWHYPNTTYPDEVGNLVILGHRWVYKYPDPRTLYALDKLQKGDEIVIYYKQREYKYKTTDMFTIKPDDFSTLGGSNKPILTLVTSHPIGSGAVWAKERLILKADLQKS